MREIKFKAKTIGNEWVFGNVSHLKKDFSTARKGHYISNSAGAPFAFMVRPETICQFTGLKDKNGKDIYEWDKFKPIHNSLGNLVKCPILVYEDLEWVLKEENLNERPNNFEYLKYFESIDLEIIGNVHTTPELLNPSNK